MAELRGLSTGLSTAMSRVPQRRHDPGRTLGPVVLALTDGVTCLSDLAALRAQPAMFGPVGSSATVWRTFDAVDRSSYAGSPSTPRRVSGRGPLVLGRPVMI